MIVLLGSRKGGCGKSTIATNIAATLSHEHDVLLVDADAQGTSSNWVNDRNDANLPVVNCVQKTGKINKAVGDLSSRYEHVVIDAAGHDSQELRTAMLVADVILCPFIPSQADVDTVEHLSNIIMQASDFNDKLKAYAILSRCPTHPANNEINVSGEYLREFMTVFPSSTSDRKAYRDAMSMGMGVTEHTDQKARREIETITGIIFNG